MKQLTEKQAIEFAKSNVWKEWSSDDIVKLQLYQDRLCVDFGLFHSSMEKVMGRPNFSHEFGFKDDLIAEYEGKKCKPTFDQIINLLSKNIK